MMSKKHISKIHPIDLLVYSVGSLLVLAGLNFGIGWFFHVPICRSLAKWLFIMATVLAFVPLVFSLVYIGIEKLVHKWKALKCPRSP
jgi:hypothetical protein